MNNKNTKIFHLGDSSIVVKFSDKINPKDNDRVYSFYNYLKEETPFCSLQKIKIKKLLLKKIKIQFQKL